MLQGALVGFGFRQGDGLAEQVLFELNYLRLHGRVLSIDLGFVQSLLLGFGGQLVDQLLL